MSGSNDSYTPPPVIKYDCISNIFTTVSSINLEVLSKHRVGDYLDINIGPNGALILEDGDGEILGSILHSKVADIIECIKNGHSYKAEIINIILPSCKVLIRKY